MQDDIVEEYLQSEYMQEHVKHIRYEHAALNVLGAACPTHGHCMRHANLILVHAQLVLGMFQMLLESFLSCFFVSVVVYEQASYHALTFLQHSILISLVMRGEPDRLRKCHSATRDSNDEGHERVLNIVAQVLSLAAVGLD